MKYLSTLVLACSLLVAPLMSSAHASYRTDALELDLMAGGLMFEYDDIDDSPDFGLRFGYHFNKHWQLELGGDFGKTEYKDSDLEFETRLLHLNILYHFGDAKFVPYVSIGGVITKFSIEDAQTQSNGGTRIGAGFKYFFNHRVGFRLDVAHLLAFDEDYHNQRWNIGQATAGLAFLIGGQGVDSDKDGVADKTDECPNSPKGARVDAKGCPTDGDMDGVFDGLDDCPDTPQGAKVDAKGCPTDSDSDGVFDGLDKCPDTAEGEKVDEKGCPLDTDMDGVIDSKDDCPDTPKGEEVDAKGCTVIKDSDGDGVFDDKDTCPDTQANAKVDENGCEIIPEKWVLEGVTFESGSDVLTEGSKPLLDKAVATLLNNTEGAIEVQGYTDSQGAASYNKRLSQKRAESVMKYLVDHGVSAERLTAKGLGEENPIADNGTAEGRAQNRRVEFLKQ